MEKVVYKQLREVIYRKTLQNGLVVTLLPKEDYRTTYALLSTDFGAIDQMFIPNGENQSAQFPPGVAHFLEHKLFETETGDVFDEFAQYGASANAFTGLTKTAYLFSCTDNVKKNLEILLQFVQTPYFTEQSVNKEKEIISQEIQMYEDQPEWVAIMGLLNNLYPHHPVNTDIAGTLESIQMITVNDLYKNHETFYQPSNMKLFIAGDIDIEQTIEWLEENQPKKMVKAEKVIERTFPEENILQLVPFESIRMDIVKPKVLIGIKGKQHSLQGREALRYSLKMEILLKLLFGETSMTYLKLYNEHQIDESFSYEHTIERQIDFLSIGGDTSDPEALTETLKRLLLTATENPDMNEAHFQLVKKRNIGQEIQSLNSLEYIAHQFVDFSESTATILDAIQIMEEINLEEIKKLASEYMIEKHLSVYHILPNL